MPLDFPNSPTGGQTYTGPGGVVWSWDGAKWVNGSTGVAALAPALNNIGRNLIHNPLMNISQRTGPFSTLGAYTLDRWQVNGSADTVTVTQLAFGDAGRAEIGDEAAANFMQNAFVGAAGAGAFTNILHRIEDVRRLAGKTVTVSFWAKAATGSPKLGINLLQNFGTGGSPSASVFALATGNAVTLSGAWVRYSTTIALPSVAGMTLGAAGHHTVLQLWCSSGATNNQVAGNIGVQSNTFQFWGVQLESGTAATILEKPDPRYDLSNCQRFASIFPVLVPALAAPSNIVFPVTMRGIPLVTGGGAGFTLANLSPSAVTISQTAAANQTLTFSADL
jgi:hypothetical protein